MLPKLISWGEITAAAKSGLQFAVQQIRHLGKTSDVLIVFPYGLHGNVPPGALALMLAVQGNTDNRAAIAWTPKNRPDLAGGEVAFYHPPTDAFIIWRTTGDLDIETGQGGSANVNINAAKTNLGEGGAKIARVGDSVQIIISSGSSAGTYNGTITSGGENTSI